MTLRQASVRISEDTSVRAALRRSSDASHQRMHGLKPFALIAAGSLPMSGYRSLLSSLFIFHSAVRAEAHIAGWSQLSSAGRRLDLLRGDLIFLGGKVPSRKCVWQAGPREAALGALYAAEGSMLGGRVISRLLDYAFGTGRDGRQFFIGDQCDGRNWAKLIQVLEARCARADALDAAIAGALRTFDLFEECILGGFGNQDGPIVDGQRSQSTVRERRLSKPVDCARL